MTANASNNSARTENLPTSLTRPFALRVLLFFVRSSWSPAPPPSWPTGSRAWWTSPCRSSMTGRRAVAFPSTSRLGWDFNCDYAANKQRGDAFSVVVEEGALCVCARACVCRFFSPWLAPRRGVPAPCAAAAAALPPLFARSRFSFARLLVLTAAAVVDSPVVSFRVMYNMMHMHERGRVFACELLGALRKIGYARRRSDPWSRHHPSS